MSESSTKRRPIHRLALFLACYVVLLISAGGLVKSLEAGLSVPDWPLSYGMLNPPRWWQIETVRAEHGHRLIAGVALILTTVLAVLVARRESRAWVRRLMWVALAAVLAQAALGGITVLFFLPKLVSISHAALAQLFLALLVIVAVATSSWWTSVEKTSVSEEGCRRVARLAAGVAAAIYGQILLGAVMRHFGAGLAIPDFPLVFGGLFPPFLDFGVGIHYAHRLGALIVATLVFWNLGRVLRLAGSRAEVRRPAILLAVLVLVQGTLGGLVVLTARGVLVNTLHVGGGALLLATAVWQAAVSWRLRKVAHSGPALVETHSAERLETERLASA